MRQRERRRWYSQEQFSGENMLKNGERDAGTILKAMRKIIEEEPLAKIDYVEMVDADTIEPLTKAEGRVLTAMAVYIGKTRLIDNFIMEL